MKVLGVAGEQVRDTRRHLVGGCGHQRNGRGRPRHMRPLSSEPIPARSVAAAVIISGTAITYDISVRLLAVPSPVCACPLRSVCSNGLLLPYGVRESSTSLTGESHSDATDSETSVLANNPLFMSCLSNHQVEIPGGTIAGAPASCGISSTLMPWRKRRTHPAAISASRIRCSARGPSSSSSLRASSATSSCFGPCRNSRPSSSTSPRSVASSCSTRPGSDCRIPFRKCARWMIGRRRSRPSWTPSSSERPLFSGYVRAAQPPLSSRQHDRSEPGR